MMLKIQRNSEFRQLKTVNSQTFPQLYCFIGIITILHCVFMVLDLRLKTKPGAVAMTLPGYYFNESAFT